MTAKDPDLTIYQTARANRERLVTTGRPTEALQEVANKATAVRENMARLRELRLAKEAEQIRTEIAVGNQHTKMKPKKKTR